MSKAKKFSCRHCGSPFEVYPPDDDHPFGVLEKPQDATGRIVEMTYYCKNKQCGHPTTIYWYRKKMQISLG